MAPPSLPQPLGRLPRGRFGDHADYSAQSDVFVKSGMFGLPATPASVGAARRRVRELLDAWGVGPDTSDNALLVTSELVTNALTHTASEQIVCRLRLTAGRLHIEVEDENRGGTLPAQRIPGPDEQCGRGLLLVGMVSSDWGVRDAPQGSGRVVWAELPDERDEPTEAGGQTAPVETTASGEVAVPVETTAAAETTVPIEMTAPVEVVVPVETEVPVGTAAPVETTAPVGTTAPAGGVPAVPDVTGTPAGPDAPASVRPAAPDMPAPVRPAAALPPAPPADRTPKAAAPATWHASAPYRTRPVPHSAEGSASHGPYGTAAPHHPYPRF